MQTSELIMPYASAAGGTRPLRDLAERLRMLEPRRITNRYELPIWMHPYRAPSVPDYPAETQSEYEIWAVLNWLHESSVAMARLVFSEMFDRLPRLRIITHHCGPEHVVFANDFPYGPESGLWFLRENIRSVDEVEIGKAERDGIYFGNALKLLAKKQA